MKRRTIVGIVTLLASLAVAAPASAYVNWPGYMFDPGHSSLNSAATAITPTNAGALAPAWATAFAPGQSGFEASPVVYNGSIYIGGKNGVFYQLDETTGAIIHQVTLGKETACGSFAYGVEDTAIVAPDPSRAGAATVYVAGGNGTNRKGGIYLWALDASTLQRVWTTDPVTVDTEAGAVGWAAPTVSNGAISVGIGSGCDQPLVQGGVGVFSQSDGTPIGGSYRTVPAGSLGGTVWSTPAALGSSTWVATGNAAQTKGAVQGDSFSIVRLRGTTKQDIWTVPSQTGTDNDFGASPTLFTGLVAGTPTPMIGDCNKNGIFYALRSGSLSAGPVWQAQIASATNGNLCNAGAVWDAGANELIMGSTQTPNRSPGAIQALSPDDAAPSRVIWHSDLPCAVVGAPTEDGAGVLAVLTFTIQGNVCATGSTPSLYLFDAHSTVPNPSGSGPPAPQLLKTIALGRSAFSQPVFADGYLFVATEGNLMAYASPLEPPPPPPPGPPTPPSSPGAPVSHNGHTSVGYAKVRGTTARVRVSCTGAAGATCKLVFRMRVTEKIRGHKIIIVTASKKPKTRKVVATVGSARGLTLIAGQSKVVQISLNRRGKRLLASHHTLKVKLDVTQILGGGRSRTLSQKVTFKAPKHKKHHR